MLPGIIIPLRVDAGEQKKQLKSTSTSARAEKKPNQQANIQHHLIRERQSMARYIDARCGGKKRMKACNCSTRHIVITSPPTSLRGRVHMHTTARFLSRDVNFSYVARGERYIIHRATTTSAAAAAAKFSILMTSEGDRFALSKLGQVTATGISSARRPAAADEDEVHSARPRPRVITMPRALIRLAAYVSRAIDEPRAPHRLMSNLPDDGAGLVRGTRGSVHASFIYSREGGQISRAGE